MGFPPVPERAQKSAQDRTFCALFVHFLCEKCGLAHFVVLFLKLAETPLFAHFNVFAFWALRPEPKYTILNFYLPLASRPMRRRTLSQHPVKHDVDGRRSPRAMSASLELVAPLNEQAIAYFACLCSCLTQVDCKDSPFTRKVKRPASRRLRKSTGVSHGSLRPFSWHQNTVKQAFSVP